MSDRALYENVAAVFASVLRGPMRSLGVPAPEADEAIARRLRLLAIYAQPGMPDELREAFGNAIKLTELSHQIGQGFLTLAEQISSLPNLPTAGLYIRARAWLDAVRSQVAPSPFDEELKQLHDSVLRVLVAATKNPARAEESVADVLRKDLMGLSDSDMTLAIMEASHLVSQVKHWRRAFDLLKLFADLGLICRGMLYSGVIETLGSRLERQASWNRFMEDVAKVPVEATSVIPIFGDLVGKVKLLVDMAGHLIDKEKALEDEAADLISRQARAREFVQLYSASILTWGGWSMPLQKTTADTLLKTHRELAGEADTSNVVGPEGPLPGDASPA